MEPTFAAEGIEHTTLIEDFYHEYDIKKARM